MVFGNSSVVSAQEAYILGLLYADGSVTGKVKNTYYTLSIALAKKDVAFLNKLTKWFNKKLNKSYKLKKQVTTNSYKLSVCNKKLIQNLINLGIHPNKTYEKTAGIFNNIADDFKKYFILGFWDGDGYVTIFKNRNKNKKLIFKNSTGCVSLNDTLLKAFESFINKQLNKNLIRCKLYDNKYTKIILNTNNAKYFLDWLYKDKDKLDFILMRKYNKYKKFTLGDRRHFGLSNSGVKGVYCIESRKHYITTMDAARGEFNISSDTLANSIAANCNGRRGICKGKHFRYLSKKELEEIKNGNVTI